MSNMWLWKSSNGWTHMVFCSFNGWTKIVQFPVFGQISQPYQKDFGNPKMSIYTDSTLTLHYRKCSVSISNSMICNFLKHLHSTIQDFADVYLRTK